MLMRLMTLLCAWALALALPACKSADKPDGAPEAQTGEEAAAPAPAAALEGPDCKSAPVDQVCCEALTPKCNECRDGNRKAYDAWVASCGKPSLADAPCGTPPVVDCCGEDSPECRACRDTALNQLMAWKTKCAAADTTTCDKPPQATVCCQAMTPSCDSCRDRVRRVQQEWQRRCR
jgi:hypothetical protein